MMKEQAIDNRVIEGFNKFLEFYEPANVNSATDFFTTGEIIKAIQDIFPVDISPVDIVSLLEENNFGYMPEPHKFSLSLKWMIKRK